MAVYLLARSRDDLVRRALHDAAMRAAERVLVATSSVDDALLAVLCAKELVDYCTELGEMNAPEDAIAVLHQANLIRRISLSRAKMAAPIALVSKNLADLEAADEA